VNRAVDLLHPLRAQSRDASGQPFSTDGLNVIEEDHRAIGDAVHIWVEWDHGRESAQPSRYGGHGDPGQDRIRIVASDQDHGPLPPGLREIGPPDIAAFH
jgi:hypothetical protein